MSELIWNLFCIAVVLGLMAGWVLNIVKIISWAEPVGWLVVRCLGVMIGPLGGVLGWL